MLKTSLEASIANGEKNLGEEKAAEAAATEEKATAEGDLATTVKDLADAEAALATAQSTCMQVAADHEVTLKGRAEELEVLAKAKQILAETTAGAEEETYSFLQETTASRLKTRADLAHVEVISLIRSLARKHHSKALEKLASQIQVLMQYGAKFGDDPFKKVKGLITELIDRLMAEAAAEATEKAYCDEQMAKTEAKKNELDTDIASLTAKIDKASADSAKLKEEVKNFRRSWRRSRRSKQRWIRFARSKTQHSSTPRRTSSWDSRAWAKPLMCSASTTAEPRCCKVDSRHCLKNTRRPAALVAASSTFSKWSNRTSPQTSPRRRPKKQTRWRSTRRSVKKTKSRRL